MHIKNDLGFIKNKDKVNYSKLTQIHNRIILFIKDKKIKIAFDDLRDLCSHCNTNDFINQLDRHFETYKNLLKYSFELTEDPEKEKIYNRLLKSLMELADAIKENIIENKNLLTISRYKQNKYSIEETEGFIENLAFEREIEQLLSDTPGVGSDSDNESHQSHLANIFRTIWMTDKLKDGEIKLMQEICLNKIMPWHDKSILVSALMLSLLRYFDEQKITLLLQFYNHKEDNVWQRALTGIVISLLFYDKRLFLYPDLIKQIKDLKKDNYLKKHLGDFVIQFIRTKETDKVTKKIEEEILPEVIKIHAKLGDKLNLDDIVSPEEILDKNPEWETMFEGTPDLYNKFEAFSKMQMEGADVFMGAFAMLKNFSFFNDLSNWFVPFYKESTSLQEIFKQEEKGFDLNAFVEGIESSFFFCNSDKYSFCLNMSNMPTMQKNMMVQLFNVDVKSMNEDIEDDELLNKERKTKIIFTQYLQDLYRFHKLHPVKNEFSDIFNMNIDIKDATIFKLLLSEKEMRNVGEFYFKSNSLKEALNIFTHLLEKEEDYELLEKIAYSYQQLQNYELAYEFYKKADLFDKNKLWLYKRMAYCCRKLDKPQDAFNYYLQAEKLAPEDLYVQAFLGHASLEMEKFEDSLKYYFKVEYLSPDNHKIQRPIGWCSFVLGKFDTAKKYFKKVIKKEANKNDLLNLGHVEWCMGNKKEAISAYKKSLQDSEYNFKWFTNAFNEDSKHLIPHGINEFDISLMLDYLQISETE